jgi:hypothetical protein
MRKSKKSIYLNQGKVEIAILEKGILTRRYYLNPTKSTKRRIECMYKDSIMNGEKYLGLSSNEFTLVWRKIRK